MQVFDKAGKYGAVSDVTIVRQKALNPYYLAAFLSSFAGQLQIERYITGATGQLHLYPRDVQKIYVPVASVTVQAEIEAMVQSALAARARSRAIQDSGNSAGEEIIRRNLEVKPTIRIRGGTRLNVLVSSDLLLKPWPKSLGDPQ